MPSCAPSLPAIRVCDSGRKRARRYCCLWIFPLSYKGLSAQSDPAPANSVPSVIASPRPPHSLTLLRAQAKGDAQVRVLNAVFLILLAWRSATSLRPARPLRNRTRRSKPSTVRRPSFPGSASLAKRCRLAEKALALGEQQFGPDDDRVAELLNNVSLIHRAQSRFAEAEQFHNARPVVAGTGAGRRPRRRSARPSDCLAELHGLQKRFPEAEAVYKRSLAVMEKARRPRSHGSGGGPQRPCHRVPRATALRRGRAPLPARPCHHGEGQGRRPSRMWPPRWTGSPPSTRCGAASPTPSRSTSARLPSRRKRWARMTRKWRPCSTSWRPAHRTQGRYAEAEPLYKRSLAIKEKALGPDHLQVAAALNELARLHETRQQYAEAAPLYRRVARHPGAGAGARAPRRVTRSATASGMAYQMQKQHARGRAALQAGARHRREDARA